MNYLLQLIDTSIILRVPYISSIFVYKLLKHFLLSSLGSPFTQCHGAVPIGDRDGGVMKDCMEDVCFCFMDDVSPY